MELDEAAFRTIRSSHDEPPLGALDCLPVPCSPVCENRIFSGVLEVELQSDTDTVGQLRARSGIFEHSQIVLWYHYGFEGV